MALAPPQPGWCDVIREYAASERDGAAADGAAPRLRGRGARVLPAARALEPGRGRSRHGRRARGGPATRGGPGRDGARRSRAAALALPARARAGARRGPLVVRRAGSGGARRVAPGSRPRGRARVPEPRRGRLPRARRARAGPRGPRRRRPPRQRARPLVALGGALRPAGHAARLDGRRPARARGVTCGRVAVRRQASACRHLSRRPGYLSRARTSHHRRRLGQPRPRRALRGPAPARGDRWRRDPRAVPGRQGREPGRRLRAARRRGDVSSAPSAATRSPTRRSPACGRPGSSSTCRNPTGRRASP